MDLYTSISDQQLAAKFVAGDEYAFATLYQRYKLLVYGYVKKFVHIEEMAADLTQEAFIKLWDSRSKLGEVQSLKAYLLTIAKNHTLTTLKKTLQSDTAMSVIIKEFKEDKNSVEEQFQNKEYEAYFRRILTGLPQRTRQIFIQCREHGRSYEEVAIELGISRNAVKKHMVNAMKTLGESVKKDLGIPLAIFLALLLK
ncbi:RNA polymerase sigma-70 factor [Pedobacter hiemivivus]|uniref:RNA polymerase sigma-70 factor n=1 Tax=Pedobacter hiemivivus TaxID=2530454 RepID=A0A4U1GLZ7_9SPHI|nr:RNA polymerase sigma-70 factor [Pedobacter hiemivivus]TKC65435.1 RNA polymerase sigma-70 factor [Pedobacter hiemivivus]